jgi:hypothetical protein
VQLGSTANLYKFILVTRRSFKGRFLWKWFLLPKSVFETPIKGPRTLNVSNIDLISKVFEPCLWVIVEMSKQLFLSFELLNAIMKIIMTTRRIMMKMIKRVKNRLKILFEKLFFPNKMKKAKWKRSQSNTSKDSNSSKKSGNNVRQTFDDKENLVSLTEEHLKIFTTSKAAFERTTTHYHHHHRLLPRLSSGLNIVEPSNDSILFLLIR